MGSVQKQVWFIQGFDGAAQSLSFQLPLKTSGKDVQTLLQRLAARHLTPEQLVGLASKRRAGGLRPTTHERAKMSLAIGDGRYRFSAEIISAFRISEAGALA